MYSYGKSLIYQLLPSVCLECTCALHVFPESSRLNLGYSLGVLKTMLQYTVVYYFKCFYNRRRVLGAEIIYQDFEVWMLFPCSTRIRYHSFLFRKYNQTTVNNVLSKCHRLKGVLNGDGSSWQQHVR